MIALTQIFNKLFKDKAPTVTLVQTALEPVHEENMAMGVEFLDDLNTLDDTPEEETK